MKLSKQNLILLSFMLFSMFFGAGNLIFPPFEGHQAGLLWLIGMLGFLVTAVGFPILGIAVIARFNGLKPLADQVHPRFSLIFTLLVYLSIGPLLAIPRAATLPYEMSIAPYLSPQTIQLGLLLFSLVFFGLSWFLSRNPSKLILFLGKILTPILLLLILAVFVAGLIHPLGEMAPAIRNYAAQPFAAGFIDGYLTMDTLAALAFGGTMAVAVRSLNLTQEKEIVRSCMLTGLLAGILLSAIYLMLAYLGATASATPLGENGAVTLTWIVTQLFGQPGILLLAIIFFLACLTTCVGLLTSCSETFHEIAPVLSYQQYLAILSIFAAIISNFGLNTILSFSVPILNLLYPLALVLIVLGLFHPAYAQNRLIYPVTLSVTAIITILNMLDQQLNFQIPFFTALIRQLPFYSLSLGWCLAACITAVLLFFAGRLFRHFRFMTKKEVQ